MIGDPAVHQTPLATLWVAARDSGYRVLENRAFKGPAWEDIWFRTLEVQAEDAGTARRSSIPRPRDPLDRSVPHCNPSLSTLRDGSRRAMRDRRRGRGTLVWLLPLVLALIPSTDTLAVWRGIDRADNRIVFAGALPGADREAHRHVRSEDVDGELDAWEVHWTARRWKVPLLRLRLWLLAPGGSYRAGERKSIEDEIRTHPLFETLALSADEAGTAESVLGPVEYLIFEAGRFRCAAWQVYLSRRPTGEADTLGDTLMTGLHCPTDRRVDARVLDTLLARIGIRGIAVPEADPVEATPARTRQDVLADLVRSGDMAGLRRIAVDGLDPDRAIPVSHPRFAGGRPIRRPLLMGAALHGHTEMAVFLIELGASTEGRAADAICAAVAADRPAIVTVLVEANPALAEYGRCGKQRDLTALGQARRLGRAAIVDILRAAQER